MALPSSHLIKWGGGTFVRAVLGPTNTGKTFRAIQRMFEYGSGMMGLPLRLLAREVYEKFCAQVGRNNVALITGEERIEPEKPKFWICTVESMPVHISVPFLVVDEIQLAVHPKRGYLFTERLLYARGTQETWFLGSDMMIPIFERLLPTVEIERMDRLSQLRCVPPKRLSQLPKRSAVVAFSAVDLYSIADTLRRLRGGVAVVFGALSPAARNAQVQMFEQGEVDYLVSTDAIGMGLNLNIRSLFFDSLRKFDGKEHRPLQAWELGQIAGRAGRYKEDGFFGLTSSADGEGGWNDSLVQAIEDQTFYPTYKVQYRNSKLDLSSIDTLKESLQQKPFSAALVPALMMEDERALYALSTLSDVQDLGAEEVSLLWDVCRIPDYHQGSSMGHHRFLGTIFRQLRGGILEKNWVERSISRLEQSNGEIDTLMERIAHTRMWSYISYRSGWIDNAKGIQERLRAAEEKLGQALHKKLSERFVDVPNQEGQAFIEPKNPRIENDMLVCDQGIIGSLRDGSFLLSGLCNRLFGWRRGMVLGRRFFSSYMEEWVRSAMETKSFHIEGRDVCYQGMKILRVEKGALLRLPKYTSKSMELLDPQLRTQLIYCVQEWCTQQIQSGFVSAKQLPSNLRGLGHLIDSFLGVAPVDELPRGQIFSEKKAQRFGIFRYQNRFVCTESLRPKHQGIRLALLLAWYGCEKSYLIPAQKVSFVCDWANDIASGFGWPKVGERAIRIDVLEKIQCFLRDAPKRAPVPNAPTQWLGCSVEEWHILVKELGYRIHEGLLLGPKKRRN